MKFVDVHSHWADSKWITTDEGLVEMLQQCAAKHIDFFLQGGVGPQDWERQLELHARYPDNFGLCFGLHPYFISDHDNETCEAVLDELTPLIPKAMAVGEMGLDFRPHILKNSEARQIEFFENQLELAKAFKKPVVLHIVQAHEKAVQILNLWGAPPEGGLVHAFNGSYETAKQYIDRGFLISVGGAVTYEKNRKLRDCIAKIPMEFLLLESDSPDQAPDGWQGPNLPTSIYLAAEKIGLIKNISAFDVLEVNTGNFKRLFRIA